MLYWRYLVFIFCGLCLSDFFHVARVRKPVWVNLNKTMRRLTRSIFSNNTLQLHYNVVVGVPGEKKVI